MKSSSSSSYSSNLLSFLTPSNLLLFFLVFLNTANATINGFYPLIQLPTNVLYRNTSKPLLLNIDDFGAKGIFGEDGDDSKILLHVWKIACSSPSPVTILIPKDKTYIINPTNFTGPCKSKLTLKIFGKIYAPGEPEAWGAFDVHKWLYFHGLNNFKLEGGRDRGLVDGRGDKWWSRSCKRNNSNPCTNAPTAITFHRCSNLKVRNINMINGQQTHISFTNCKHVLAVNVTVLELLDSPINTNGIHISSSTNVELKDLIISTGNDCISIVGNSSRICINGVVILRGHGISLGKYNTYTAVEDVIVNGVHISNTKYGVRIRTWQGGSGFARNFTFQNILMNNVSNPIVIDQYYCDSSVPCLNQTSAVSIEDISFRGIKGISVNEEAMIFKCSDTYPCNRIHLENIQLATSSGIANSVCWEAYGTSRGYIFPPPCISSGDMVIRHNVKPNSTYWRKDYYAFF